MKNKIKRIDAIMKGTTHFHQSFFDIQVAYEDYFHFTGL